MNARLVHGAALVAAWVAASPISSRAEVTAAANATSPPPASAPAETVQLSAAVWDVLRLTRAKVAEDVVVSFVQNNDRRYNLSASEIIYLRKENVPDRVLVAMLNQNARPAPAIQPIQSPTPAYAPVASASQYVPGYTPTTTTTYETAPASTVYVFPESSRYSYASYPYTYPSYYSGYYSYPYFSVGFSYGNYGSYYGGWWNGSSSYCGPSYYRKSYYGNGYCGPNGYVGGSYYPGGYRNNGSWSSAGTVRVVNPVQPTRSGTWNNTSPGPRGQSFSRGTTFTTPTQVSAPSRGSSFTTIGRGSSPAMPASFSRPAPAPSASRVGSFSRPSPAPTMSRGSSMASVGRASAPRPASPASTGGGGFRAGRSR